MRTGKLYSHCESDTANTSAETLSAFPAALGGHQLPVGSGRLQEGTARVSPRVPSLSLQPLPWVFPVEATTCHGIDWCPNSHSDSLLLPEGRWVAACVASGGRPHGGQAVRGHHLLPPSPAPRRWRTAWGVGVCNVLCTATSESSLGSSLLSASGWAH